MESNHLDTVERKKATDGGLGLVYMPRIHGSESEQSTLSL